MIDRRVLLSLILALVLLGLGSVKQIAYAASPDPMIAGRQPRGSLGYDISFPQCPSALPTAPFAFAVVGVTEGTAFSTNDCLHDEFVWAQQSLHAAPGLYLNIHSVMWSTASQSMDGPKGKCAWSNYTCQAYNYGYNTVLHAFNYAKDQGATTQMWWLDVEWMNYWTDNTALNDLVIQGAVDFVVGQGAAVGIYSTPLQWSYIAGPRFVPSLPQHASMPLWLATAAKKQEAANYCSLDNAFGGGTVWYVQYPGATFDENYMC